MVFKRVACFFAILVMCTSSFISNFVLIQPMEAPSEIFINQRGRQMDGPQFLGSDELKFHFLYYDMCRIVSKPVFRI